MFSNLRFFSNFFKFTFFEHNEWPEKQEKKNEWNENECIFQQCTCLYATWPSEPKRGGFQRGWCVPRLSIHQEPLPTANTVPDWWVTFPYTEPETHGLLAFNWIATPVTQEPMDETCSSWLPLLLHCHCGQTHLQWRKQTVPAYKHRTNGNAAQMPLYNEPAISTTDICW